VIIGYKKDVDGVLRAAIALARNPGATMVCGASAGELREKLAMYHGDIVLSVDEVVKDVPFQVKAELWVKLPSCSPMQRSLSLGSYLTFALRSHNCVPDELVRLLARYYPKLTAILAHKDDTARKYFKYYREAMGELERLKAHVRFRPSGDALYAEISPQHEVKDLFMEWAMRRIPDRIIVVKCRQEHYILNARSLGYSSDVASVTAEEAGRLLGSISDSGSEAWDTYYDSQSIENRRNKRYAKSRLPAKYSYISPEVRKERKKIEHGIQGSRLDDYLT
jgi:probable DNA metabolism protein